MSGGKEKQRSENWVKGSKKKKNCQRAHLHHQVGRGRGRMTTGLKKKWMGRTRAWRLWRRIVIEGWERGLRGKAAECPRVSLSLSLSHTHTAVVFHKIVRVDAHKETLNGRKIEIKLKNSWEQKKWKQGKKIEKGKKRDVRDNYRKTGL